MCQGVKEKTNLMHRKPAQSRFMLLFVIEAYFSKLIFYLKAVLPRVKIVTIGFWFDCLLVIVFKFILYFVVKYNSYTNVCVY